MTVYDLQTMLLMEPTTIIFRILDLSTFFVTPLSFEKRAPISCPNSRSNTSKHKYINGVKNTDQYYLPQFAHKQNIKQNTKQQIMFELCHFNVLFSGSQAQKS